MAGDVASETEQDRPAVTVCRRCPDTRVFIESGNTDGWIASDLTVELVE